MTRARDSLFFISALALFTACNLIVPFSSHSQVVIFSEDWNSGVIEPSRWAVLKVTGETHVELEDIGGGDYAIFTKGHDDSFLSEWENSFWSVDTFPRGDDLRCTFKAWFDFTKPRYVAAGNAACINGPWHFRHPTDPPALKPFLRCEAAITVWSTYPFQFAQDDVFWSDIFETDALSAAFDDALVSATATAPLMARVWLGNTSGAKCEWSDDGGNTWTEELDDREMRDPGLAHSEVHLAFGTYFMAAFIEDIVVENNVGLVPTETPIPIDTPVPSTGVDKWEEFE